MSKSIAPTKEKKGVAWYIPSALRHWLNSHAEYLSAIGEEISTDAMVVKWLTERVMAEERKRDSHKLEHALERRSQDAAAAAGGPPTEKDGRNKGGEKKKEL
jgi:hypothetical protein